jgi:hypothetical protein
MSHRLFTGEDCTAGSRVYVQDSVYDKFVELLIEKVKSTPVGDGFDDTVTNGPLVSELSPEVCSATSGSLTQKFDRFQKPILIGCGVTSNLENEKVPELWPAEKDARAVDIS